MTNKLQVTKLKRGQSRSLEDRVEIIQIIAERIERGENIATYQLLKDMPELGTRDTAIAYRNAALKLINQESRAWNRDTVRNMEIGRLQAQLGRLNQKLEEFAAKNDIDPFIKLVSKVNETAALLHRITGVNQEVQFNITEQKRIHIIRAEQVTPVQPIIEQ